MKDFNPDSISEFVTTVQGMQLNPLQSARAVWAWVSQHISYDWSMARGLQLGQRLAQGLGRLSSALPGAGLLLNSPICQDTFQNRKAVCAGFARLTEGLCGALGVDCRFVGGWAKTSSHMQQLGHSRHAWNTVAIQGKSFLVDSCWSSGEVLNSWYFGPPPSKLIYTHFPECTDFQLLKDPLTSQDFLKLPLLLSRFWQQGLEPLEPQRAITAGPNEIFKFKMKSGRPIHEWNAQLVTFLETGISLEEDIFCGKVGLGCETKTSSRIMSTGCYPWLEAEGRMPAVTGDGEHHEIRLFAGGESMGAVAVEPRAGPAEEAPSTMSKAAAPILPERSAPPPVRPKGEAPIPPPTPPLPTAAGSSRAPVALSKAAAATPKGSPLAHSPIATAAPPPLLAWSKAPAPSHPKSDALLLADNSASVRDEAGVAEINCPIYDVAKQILLEELNVQPSLLNPAHDRCFCPMCSGIRGESRTTVHNRCGKKYACPFGWVCFGLSINSGRAQASRVFEEWPVCFHGTTKEAARSIASSQNLLMPGDVLPDGARLGIRRGHIPNEDFVFTSPSVRYIELSVYATPQRIEHGKASGMNYRVAFQLRQMPDTFHIQAETVAASRHGERIDELFENHELEWKSNRRDTHFPYKIMISPVELMRVSDRSLTLRGISDRNAWWAEFITLASRGGL